MPSLDFSTQAWKTPEEKGTLTSLIPPPQTPQQYLGMLSDCLLSYFLVQLP